MSIVKDYLFAVDLKRCVGSCNTLDNLCNRVFDSNEIEDLNFRVFNMVTKINELKTLAKYISCKCICKFDSKKCKSNQKWE